MRKLLPQFLLDCQLRGMTTKVLLLLLLLTVVLPFSSYIGVTAQTYPHGSTTYCAKLSTRFFRVGGANWESEYHRLVKQFDDASAARYQCPWGSICAQRMTAEEDRDVVYSEDCWDENSVTEYTEVACFTDLCNRNLTFGSYSGLRRSNFRPGVNLQCYNHGQLTGLQIFNQIINVNEYRSRYGRSLPVSQWRGGMCGAAIYSSGKRGSSVHERVLTGDRKQKFALLRVCPHYGCDRFVLRDFIQLGYY